MSARALWPAVAASLIRRGKHQFEACPARAAGPIAQIAAVCPGKGLCDREAQAGALSDHSRALAAREALEQLGHELRIDAGPAVLDCEPEMPVPLLGLDPHRRIAVPTRIRDQVRDDPIEGRRIGDRLELRRHLEHDRRCLLWYEGGDEGADAAADGNRLRSYADRLGLEPREVEQLLDELAQALALAEEGAPKLVDLVFAQLPASQVERCADPVDGRRRTSQLVRGEGNEVRLQLVETTQLVVCEGGLEKGRHQGADRPQQLSDVRIQLERFSASVGRQEADAPTVAQER